MSKGSVASKTKTGVKRQPKKKKNEATDFDAIFAKIDLNNDGRISVIELTKAAHIIGLNPTKAEAEQMIADCNPKQKGYITKKEFRDILKKNESDVEKQQKEMTEAFKVFDKDGSGSISADEIKNVLRACGEELDEQDVDDMIRYCDVDGDGMISCEEFAAVMCNMDGM